MPLKKVTAFFKRVLARRREELEPMKQWERNTAPLYRVKAKMNPLKTTIYEKAWDLNKIRKSLEKIKEGQKEIEYEHLDGTEETLPVIDASRQVKKLIEELGELEPEYSMLEKEHDKLVKKYRKKGWI